MPDDGHQRSHFQDRCRCHTGQRNRVSVSAETNNSATTDMSALPRKQTCAVQLGMSAMGQKRAAFGGAKSDGKPSHHRGHGYLRGSFGWCYWFGGPLGRQRLFGIGAPPRTHLPMA
jgi:hypothetical protein